MKITDQTALNSIPYLSQRLREALEQDALKSAYIAELLEQREKLEAEIADLKRQMIDTHERAVAAAT